VSLAQEAGIDGMLVVDLPPEESENLGKLCADYGLSLVWTCPRRKVKI